jgi:hypothetical protein
MLGGQWCNVLTLWARAQDKHSCHNFVLDQFAHFLRTDQYILARYRIMREGDNVLAILSDGKFSSLDIKAN